MDDKIVYAEDKKLELLEIAKTKPKFRAVTGMATLDAVVDGFRKGQLIVVSGPPKNGKTAVCQTFTKKFVLEGFKCLWFSYELGYEEIFEKFPMEKLDFYVPNYIRSGNLDWIEKKIEEAVSRENIDIVFIDNLDFLRDPDILRGIDLNLSSYVGGIVQKLKSMAVKYNVVIFLMTHIRKNKWTTNDLPSSEELRDSGQIAQLADIVMMIVRRRNRQRDSEDVYDGNNALLGVIENRHNGRTKKIPVIFSGNEIVELYTPRQEEYGALY